MQLFAFVRVSQYQEFLTKESLQDTRESFQQFLKQVGTTSIRFNIDESADYKKVPSGSCVRLLSTLNPGKKEEIVLQPEPTLPTASFIPAVAPVSCCLIM